MKPSLSYSGPVPIYQQIRDWMRQQIASNIWSEHHKLKAESDLAIELGVSRGTVRKAIGELIAEGLLVQVHGRGTFVSSNRLEQPLADRLVAFSEDLIDRNIPFETHVLKQALIRPSQRLVSLLSVSTDAEILYLERVRSVKGMPFIYLRNYVVLQHCPKLRDIDFSQVRLLQALEEICGLELDWAQRTFEAQTADEEIAGLLKMEPRDPVMYMEQVLYLRGDSPIEVSDLWLRGSSYRLSAIVKRESKSSLSAKFSKRWSSMLTPDVEQSEDA